MTGVSGVRVTQPIASVMTFAVTAVTVTKSVS